MNKCEKSEDAVVLSIFIAGNYRRKSTEHGKKRQVGIIDDTDEEEVSWRQ
jgi:hypothetical protein